METKDFEQLKLKNQVCFPLYACSKELTRQYGPHLKKLGLTYTQYIVMMVLWEQESLSSRDLANCTHLDYGTLTPVLKRLESFGYINRRRMEKDERLLEISLTKEGRALKERAADIPFCIAECVGLSKEEFETLYKLTYKALNNMESK